MEKNKPHGSIKKIGTKLALACLVLFGTLLAIPSARAQAAFSITPSSFTSDQTIHIVGTGDESADIFYIGFLGDGSYQGNAASGDQIVDQTGTWLAPDNFCLFNTCDQGNFDGQTAHIVKIQDASFDNCISLQDYCTYAGALSSASFISQQSLIFLAGSAPPSPAGGSFSATLAAAAGNSLVNSFGSGVSRVTPIILAVLGGLLLLGWGIRKLKWHMGLGGEDWGGFIRGRWDSGMERADWEK